MLLNDKVKCIQLVLLLVGNVLDSINCYFHHTYFYRYFLHVHNHTKNKNTLFFVPIECGVPRCLNCLRSLAEWQELGGLGQSSPHQPGYHWGLYIVSCKTIAHKSACFQRLSTALLHNLYVLMVEIQPSLECQISTPYNLLSGGRNCCWIP